MTGTDTQNELIAKWLQIGQSNYWIRNAADPAFNLASFQLVTIDDLVYRLCVYGNWSLGQAFYYDNICFIQQVNGGDEWLVIKNDVAFESVSPFSMGRTRFLAFLASVEAATVEACRTLTY